MVSSTMSRTRPSRCSKGFAPPVVALSVNPNREAFSPWGINDPSEGSRQILTDPWDTSASPFTWLGDGSTNYTVTRGNNGIAQSNPSGGSSYLNNHRPSSASQKFEYAYSPSTTTPSSYVDASITQLFYTANTSVFISFPLFKIVISN